MKLAIAVFVFAAITVLHGHEGQEITCMDSDTTVCSNKCLVPEDVEPEYQCTNGVCELKYAGKEFEVCTDKKFNQEAAATAEQTEETGDESDDDHMTEDVEDDDDDFGEGEPEEDEEAKEEDHKGGAKMICATALFVVALPFLAAML